MFLETEQPTHAWTEAQAVAQARLYDDIIAQRTAYSKAEVAQMKAVNPDLRIYAYLNGALAQFGDKYAYPDSWYVKDPAGNKVRNDWNLWMMDVANPGWVANRRNLCQELVASTGFDACYLDNLGYGFMEYNWLSGVPLNPRTGKRWTNTEWLSATSALAQNINSAMPHPVAVNGLVNGAVYFGSPSAAPLVSSTDVGLAEVFLRTSQQSASSFPDVARWRKDLDMVLDMARRGKPLMVTTKVWSAASDAQRAQWNNFGLATLLLGTNGMASYSFIGQRVVSPLDRSALDTLTIGAPAAGFSVTGNVYSRPFTNGKALVNPSGTGQTVSLGGTFKDQYGTYMSSVYLAPKTGLVLQRA